MIRGSPPHRAYRLNVLPETIGGSRKWGASGGKNEATVKLLQQGDKQWSQHASCQVIVECFVGTMAEVSFKEGI